MICDSPCSPEIFRAIDLKNGLMTFPADGHATRTHQPQPKPLPPGALQAAAPGPAAEVSDTERSAVLPHPGHSMLSTGRRWIFSVSLPQSPQWYSKMGISFTTLFIYSYFYILFIKQWQEEIIAARLPGKWRHSHYFPVVER